VLILPPGHAQAVRTRRTLSRREKRMVGGVLVVVLALAVALSISFAVSGPSSSNGCIDVTIAGPVGAEQIHQCGGQARDTCASARTPGTYTGDAAQTIVAACRRARLPVGA
jgi:hypothetical protein